jgi:hypothetical protein
MTGPGGTGGHGRFVVLLHRKPDGDCHYDLILEYPTGAATCPTWSFSEPPAEHRVVCRRIFDHPRRFLTYEGELRAERGRVWRIDAGECTVCGEDAGTFVVMLKGDRTTGRFFLTPVPDDDGGSEEGCYTWEPRT